MEQERAKHAIRVAVAAPFPDMVRLHQTTAEYADELEVCAMISDADVVLDQARLLQPDVLLLSEGLVPNRGDTLARLNAVAPATRLVVLLAGGPGAGPVIADAVVPLGAPASDLREAIVSVAGHGHVDMERPARWSATMAPTATLAAAVPPETAPQAPPQPRPGLVVVFSGKGGVGTSVVATNLATTLALGGASVALIDLNLQYGDVGLLLHLEEHAISIDAVTAADEQADPSVLDEALATSAQGVRVLLAPASPESSDLVSPAGLAGIVSELCGRFDHVVVDSSSQLDERLIGVMEVAERILLVSSFAITSVKDTKVTLRLLQSLAIEPTRVAVVLNQTRRRVSVEAGEIERSLRFPVLGTLPYEPRIDESLDDGRPLVAADPRSRFSRELARVAAQLGAGRGAGQRAGKHRSRWRLRRGR